MNSESLQYQPANPPYEIELHKCNAEDYLLLFRSENRSNTRFGGFLIFIAADPAVLKKEADFDNMSDAERAAFVEDAAYNLPGPGFNLGRDKQVPVLFSNDISYLEGSTVETDDGVSYIIKARLDKNSVSADSWMTLRSYLTEKNEIISVSPPGNVVLIKP